MFQLKLNENKNNQNNIKNIKKKFEQNSWNPLYSVYCTEDSIIINYNYNILQCQNQLIEEFIPYKNTSDVIFYSSIYDYTIQSIESNDLIERWNKFNYIIKENDWSIKLIEDLLIFYASMKEAIKADYNKSKILVAIITFSKLRCQGSLVNNLFYSNLLKRFETLFNYDEEIYYNSIDDTYEIQSFESVIDTCRTYLDKYNSISDSEFIKKLYKLVTYAMSLSLFDKLGYSLTDVGYSLFESEAIKKKYNSKKDFILILLDTFLFLCERGFQIIQTGNVEKLFHSGETYSQFFDKYQVIKRQSTLLSNPQAHNFNESSFRADLDDLIEKGSAIVKHGMRISSSDRRFLNTMLNDLQLIRCDLCTKRAAREHRKAPFSVLIFGESGIGKSTIKDLFFNHFAKVKKLDNDSSFCYTRNPVANFWDGFTTSQWAIILDDVAALHPNKAPNGDPSMMELIQLINSVPFVPDQADLSDKGRTPVKCELVIATTNVKDLNAYYYFAHPSAVQRRLPWIITPTVKKQYAHVDGTLDSSKTEVKEGYYPDFWTWKIEKVLTRKTTDKDKKAILQVVLETDSVYELLKWYNDAIKDFSSNQDLVEQSVTSMKNIDLCDVCFLPKTVCDCEIQSSIVIDSIYSLFNYCLLLRAISRVLDYIFIAIYVLYYYTCEEIIFHSLERCFWFRIARAKVKAWVGIRRVLMCQRTRMRNIGNKIKDSIGFPKFLLSISTILISSITLYKVFNFYKNQSVDTKDIGERPLSKNEERENVWYKNDFTLSEFELSRNTLSSLSLSREKFINIIKHNIIHFKIRTGLGTCYIGKATCLKGQIFMTNNHIIPIIEDECKMEITLQNSKDGITKNIVYCLTENMIQRDFKNDVAYFAITVLPPFKDITKYFALNHLDIKTRGFLINMNGDGSISTKNLSCIKKSGWNVKPFPTFEGKIWSSKIDSLTQNGDCGSLMIGETAKGFVILGIHILANELTCSVGAIELLQKDIDIDRFNKVFCVQSNPPKISSESTTRSVIDLHRKSVFRYLERGSAKVYGSFAGFRTTPKTSVQITPMANFLSNFDYKIKYGPPVMSGWEPWYVAAVEMVDPILDINQNIVDQCKKSYLNKIFSQIKDFSEVQIYDDFTTINGALGISYIDKINRNTSAGNPWKKSKKHFMHSVDEQFGLHDAVDVSDEIKRNVNEIVDKYHNDERAMPNFCAHLKDEPLSFKKIKMKKTRVFTGAPLDFTIVVRKYLLSTIRLIQNNRYVFEAGPGTIAQSAEWEEMFRYITKFGRHKIVAGDYKSYDKKMSPIFILAAFDVLREICSVSGNYDENALKVICGISMDTAFPVVDFNGDLIQFYGSNPSGHPLTVIINSIVNSLYMRYAYYLTNPNNECETFSNNVALMTYGDDNIMSVSDLAPWFNHTTISDALSRMGITYTMADKESASVPYIHINDSSFLKRSWRFDKDLGLHLATLDHDSIERSLMIWTRSKTISAEEQCIAVISTAVREYFFYGKEIFESKSLLLKQLVVELDIEDWLNESTFPTWESLVNDFRTNSKHVIL